MVRVRARVRVRVRARVRVRVRVRARARARARDVCTFLPPSGQKHSAFKVRVRVRVRVGVRVYYEYWVGNIGLGSEVGHVPQPLVPSADARIVGEARRCAVRCACG